MVENSTKEVKGKNRWDGMSVGDKFEFHRPIAYQGNQWAERNDLDWEFSSTKLARRKYEIKRIK